MIRPDQRSKGQVSAARKTWLGIVRATRMLNIYKADEEVEKYPGRKRLESPLPAPLKMIFRRDYTVGLVVPMTDEIRETRENLGLEPIPPTAHKFEEALRDKLELLRSLKASKVLGYVRRKRKFMY